VFRARLGDGMTVLHSGLSEQERYEQWRRLQRGEIALVIGARSAIFAPFSDLGLILVDEEHETSYKQEHRFAYHARSLAVMRAKLCGATVVLGSATPSLESYQLALENKWTLLTMKKRILNRPLPKVELIDLRTHTERAEGIFAPPLLEALRERIARGEQSILFLNRRGFHTQVLCPSCGHTYYCPHCSVSLTHHQFQGLLLCHYCGYSMPLPSACSVCGFEGVERLGWGTEKVEQALHELLPNARILRMDRDTTQRKGQMEEAIAQFATGQKDILIGTQMVAKGHDFPNVTLVGVLLADQGLHMQSDFRSAERTFQLLVQVAGRAGRGHKAGRVLIQTFQPDHPAIVTAQRQDFEAFFQQEIALRRAYGYPPFGHLVGVRFEGEDEQQLCAFTEEVGHEARQLLKKQPYSCIQVLGPVPSQIEKIQDRFRRQMLCKSPSRNVLHAFLWQLTHEVLETLPTRGIKVMLDVDPIQML
ncbi:MAG: primosomal protein N', partial [Myxococcota bacterium]